MMMMMKNGSNIWIRTKVDNEDKQELMTNNVVGLIEFRVDIILVNRKNVFTDSQAHASLRGNYLHVSTL